MKILNNIFGESFEKTPIQARVVSFGCSMQSWRVLKGPDPRAPVEAELSRLPFMSPCNKETEATRPIEFCERGPQRPKWAIPMRFVALGPIYCSKWLSFPQSKSDSRGCPQGLERGHRPPPQFRPWTRLSSLAGNRAASQNKTALPHAKGLKASQASHYEGLGSLGMLKECI